VQNNEHLKCIILSDVEGVGTDPVEGDMLVGLNKERPTVWRGYTRKGRKRW
jgi:hypothetical protein